MVKSGPGPKYVPVEPVEPSSVASAQLSVVEQQPINTVAHASTLLQGLDVTSFSPYFYICKKHRAWRLLIKALPGPVCHQLFSLAGDLSTHL